MNDWDRRCSYHGNEGAYLSRIGYTYKGRPPKEDPAPYVAHWLRKWHADPNNYWRYVRDFVVWC